MLGSRRGRTVALLLGGLSVAAALSLGIAYFHRYGYYVVEMGSMEPTIPRGSRIKVEKLRDVSVADLSHGDLMIFEGPKGDSELLYVQRVIGLPGDTIEVRSKIVFRNGEELHEPYIRHLVLGAIPLTDDLPPLEVPAGHAFLMGDNRDNVVDSRIWGAIPFTAIKGRVIGITKAGGG